MNVPTNEDRLLVYIFGLHRTNYFYNTFKNNGLNQIFVSDSERGSLGYKDSVSASTYLLFEIKNLERVRNPDLPPGFAT
jgi:hypothetical protein